MAEAERKRVKEGDYFCPNFYTFAFWGLDRRVRGTIFWKSTLKP